MNPLSLFKSVYSVGLLIFSVVCIMALIAKEMTGLSSDVHPAAAYIAIWVAILWLTMVEGGQASLVGLAPVNPEIYKDSHPLAYKCTQLAHKGDNLDRYLLGRQFMVVLVVFTVNISGGPTADAELWGFPEWLMGIFFSYGLAMILFTCMIGQLNTQVNASLCMLDYINNYFALFTLWVAMAIEFSGLLHSAYVVQLLVAKLAGSTIQSNEEPRSMAQNIFFWSRCAMSVAILAFSFAVTLTALFADKTTMWDGVPAWVAVIVFFILMSVVGMLEGMQIAFFAVAKIPSSERGDSVWALKTCNLLYFGEGNNLPGFMVGRQLCVVSCMLFIARVTSVDVAGDGSENIFGASEGFQALFNTGLLGAFITTIVASISWQLVASAFPIAFLSSPVTYFLLRWCLLLESTGICAGAWVIAAVHKKLAGFQRDEVYIGTAESRSKMDMSDHSTRINMGPGHPVKLPNFVQSAPMSLQKLLKKDPSVGNYLNSIHDDVEAGKNKEGEDSA
jgi:silicon transporter